MGRTAEKRETPEQRWEEPRVLAGYGQIEGLMPGMTGVVDPDDLAECRRREHMPASQAPRTHASVAGAAAKRWRQRSMTTVAERDGGSAAGQRWRRGRTAVTRQGSGTMAASR